MSEDHAMVLAAVLAVVVVVVAAIRDARNPRRRPEQRGGYLPLTERTLEPPFTTSDRAFCEQNGVAL